jgi:hypothetical protein
MITDEDRRLLREELQKTAAGKQVAKAGWDGVVKNVGATLKGAKDTLEYVVDKGLKVAPYVLALPVVLGLGAGYASSKLTSPSEETEAQAQSELLKAEQERALIEMERNRKSAMTPVKAPAKGRSLRI